MVAGTVAIKVHHVEDIALSLIFWDRVLIVRAENIQVVIDTDVNVVVTPLESVGKKNKGSDHSDRESVSAWNQQWSPSIILGLKHLV